jgi:hypothetical protein
MVLLLFALNVSVTLPSCQFLLNTTFAHLNRHLPSISASWTLIKCSSFRPQGQELAPNASSPSCPAQVSTTYPEGADSLL